MIPKSNLMLDPLVALLAGSKVSGPTGSIPQVQADAALFGDILGLLGNFKTNNAELLSLPKSNADERTQYGSSVSDMVAPASNFLAVSQSGLAPAVSVPVVETSAMQTETPPSSGLLAHDDATLDAVNRFAQEAAAGFVSPETNKTDFAVSQVPTTWYEIPENATADGAFRVLSSKQIGDQLELRLVSASGPNNVLKLTLPTEFVRTAASDNGAAAAAGKSPATPKALRVSLPETYPMAGPFDELLGKLKVSEITLNSEPVVRQSESAPELIRFTITVVRSEGASHLITTVPKAQVRILSAAPVSVSVSQTGISVNEMTVRSEADPSKAAIPATGTVRTDGVIHESQVLSSTPTAVKWDADEKTIESMFDTKSLQPGVDRTAMQQRPVDTPPVKAPVRFTLPDMPPTLTTGTKTLTVKLEPEHLGPARLHLSVVNDTVSARLSVDTAAAKVAVERSLDQLTDQLSRAGIKVNYIEVSLRGGSQHEAFHRQANWFRPQQRQVRVSADEGAITSMAMQAIASPPSRTYLNARSVNLFA
ncbi:MAG: flagellar hook-length control protein FliK [Candidatus Zixiibacteriota bacterium]